MCLTPNLNGIQDVQVEVYDSTTGGNSIASAVTAADGKYLVAGLATGSYKVHFAGPAGYVSEWYDDYIGPPWGADDVLVNEPNDTPGINAQLADAGSISGTVDCSGDKFQGINVSVYDSTTGNYIAFASTAADGTYTVAGLPTGSYKVEFDGTYLGFIKEWYNNKATDCAADVVPVTAPNDTPEINANLAIGGKIAGTVTDSSGAKLQNVYVYVHDIPTGNSIAYAVTAADGTYTVAGLPTGSYKVEFYLGAGYIPEWYNDQRDFCSAQAVSVTVPNTTGEINAKLAIGGSISGTVTDSSAAGLQNVYVYVYDLAENFIAVDSTTANGTYTVSGLPTGSYKIKFYANTTGYFDEWYNNKGDFDSAAPISVTAPNDTPGINAGDHWREHIRDRDRLLCSKITECDCRGVRHL